MAISLDPFSPLFLETTREYMTHLQNRGAYKISFLLTMQEAPMPSQIFSLASRIRGIKPLIIERSFYTTGGDPRTYSFVAERRASANFAARVNGFSMHCTLSGKTLSGNLVTLAPSME